MRNSKISIFAIGCVICAGFATSAHGVATVRKLGGTGTAAGASSVTSSAINSVRAAGTVSGTTTVGSTQRLAIGKNMKKAVAITGTPTTPGTSSGGSSSGGTVDPDTASGLRSDIDQLQRDFDNLTKSSDKIADALDKKQNKLTSADSYIIIDPDMGEISVDIEKLAGVLGGGASGENGRAVEIDYVNEELVWRYVGDATWRKLISRAELMGPQGEKGEPGEPGDATLILEEYSTTEQMDLAIKDAINAALEGVNTGLDAKADAASVYTKQETDDAIDAAVAGAVAGDLTGYAKSDYVDSELSKKADTNALANLAFKDAVSNSDIADNAEISKSKLAADVRDSLDLIDTMGDTIGNVASIAETNATNISTLSGRVSTADDDIGTLRTTIGTGELATTAKNIVGAINEIKERTDGMPTDANLNEINERIDSVDVAVAQKANAATTLAGYGIENAYTKNETDLAIAEYAIPRPDEKCMAASGRCVLSIGTDGKLKWLDVTDPEK